MFKQYVANEQFNLQINRFLNDYYQEDERANRDLKGIIPRLTGTEGWFEAWLEYAVMREEQQDYDLASVYYQAAEFYLAPSDPNKEKMYQKYRETFYKGFHDFVYESYQIPYDNSYLPAIKLLTPGADKTLLVFGGYDSYMEEMVKMMNFIRGINYHIIVFDGPGQGTALKNGLKFIHNWEKPVSAVIDYFKLDRVSIMGASWGGYFAMRAAAFEKRIDKVIAFNIFYSGLDALKIRMPEDVWNKLTSLLAANEADKVNAMIQKMMASNIDLNWKVTKGMENTGEKTPFTLIKNFEKHTMAGIGQFINQDVLLLAGEADQYVPISRLLQIQHELFNAGSITTKVFTKETGGEQHCQAGHRDLAFHEIKKFL
ncbi:alpha/beta hydrolase family protein [Brevibacillus laterosporus]|uniref:alpha/beta hydrolase family protein n=1 Tax=Brevibacillus laterosporus TaxID=1465 RepID=UPI0014446864|nr:alpha/beta hydrolase [Brevibacillus laterosporus]NKQ20740.1 alpha/beta hydrolase [Brevibacillus laterosporus]WNX29650.1 alpha/beta hydrolase [Brevibacillus laterosporus]